MTVNSALVTSDNPEQEGCITAILTHLGICIRPDMGLKIKGRKNQHIHLAA
jgi:hypothetical protein